MPKKYTPEEKAKIAKKFQPKNDAVYIVTDSCFWKDNPPENYNFSDPDRKPHAIELVDPRTGTVVYLPSGSLISVVAADSLEEAPQPSKK